MLVTDDNKHQMLEHLASEKLFSLDTETTGLDWNDRAFAVTIATSKKVFYMEHWDFLKHIFHLPLEVIMINAKYDMRMIGLPFHSPWIIRDIGIFERILRNDGISLASYSLDAIAKRRLGKAKSDEVENYIKAYKLYEERETKYTKEVYKNKRFDQVDRSILMQYAMSDASLTYDIYQDQLKSADEDDTRVFNNECALLHCTYKMEMEGIKIDEEYTEKALHWEAGRLEEAKEKFKGFAGFKYENKKKILIPFFEKHGEHINLTAKGNPSLTDDDLEGFKSPAAKLVQEIRYHEKRISTYFTSYLDLVDSNSFIHPNIIQHGTATGRFSYASPNLQNTPKDEPDENPYTVRGCFVPSSKQNVFLSLDYDQQEYRLMLDYANEAKVIREVLGGKDLHQSIADMCKITRKNAKTLNFACIAEGELVLTNHGLVPIEKVTVDMCLWDGLEWVPHEGVVYNGEKEVIAYNGLTATRDHIVFTEEEGEVSLEGASSRKLSLAVSGNKGAPVRVSYDNFRSIQRRKISKGIGKMREMFWYIQYIFVKYYRSKDKGLSMPEGGHSRSMHEDKSSSYAIQTMDCNKTKMSEQEMQRISSIRRKRDKIKDDSKGVYGFLYTIFGKRFAETSDRSNKQQWALRDREYPIYYPKRKCKEYTKKQTLYVPGKEDNSDRPMGEYKERLSKFSTGQGTNDETGPCGYSLTGHYGKKTKRKVYDILNAGPRNRFTVSDKLVHNCLYGSGPQKVSEMLGISVRDARKLRDNYLLELPKVDKFISDVIGVNRKRGFVKNWLGRKLRNKYDFSYKAPNHLIQGGCGDVIKVAMVKIHNLLKDTGIKMRLQVHDQLVFEGEKEELMHNYAEIRNIMQTAYTPMNGTVLTVSASYSEESFAERTMKKWN